MTVRFFIAYPYYFPHFIPISAAFEAAGFKTEYVLSEKQNTPLMCDIAEAHQLNFVLGEHHLHQTEPEDVTFFANASVYIDEVQGTTVFLEHGIGNKSTQFYPLVEKVDVYFVEGEYKYQRIKNAYPEHADKLHTVGFSKFDPVFNATEQSNQALYARYQLDADKKTILYAPTFFPSSIEKMAKNFPQDFADYNVLIKAHYLTYERSRYEGQQRQLAHWATFDNCTVVDVVEYNLLPLMQISDVMVSDESSAMFEFAALGKPVVTNRFFKLRLSYYLFPLKLEKRIDSQKARFRDLFMEANNYQETKTYANQILSGAQTLQPNHQTLVDEILGVYDGAVSERIVDVIASR